MEFTRLSADQPTTVNPPNSLSSSAESSPQKDISIRTSKAVGYFVDDKHTEVKKSKSGESVSINCFFNGTFAFFDVFGGTSSERLGTASLCVFKKIRQGESLLHRWSTKSYGLITMVEVEEKGRNDGIGGLLLDSIIEVARVLRLDALMGEVESTNTIAIHLDEKKGFVKKPFPQHIIASPGWFMMQKDM